MKSRAVKQLEIDLYECQRSKYPNVPAHARPRPTRTDSTANGLTRCIIDYIRLHGGQAERINITGRPIETAHGLKWTKSHMTIGTADISAIINGRAVKIEVKAGHDQQSDAQKAYQKQIESAGGIYYIARNFADFVTFINSII